MIRAEKRLSNDMKCKSGAGSTRLPRSFGKVRLPCLPRGALVICLTATIALSAVPAQAGLKQENDINQGLLVIAVADKIRRACDGIGAKIFTAQRYVTALKNLASERGYSDDEINDYINNKSNKAEMRERRNNYFQARGASNLDAESLCVLGKTEIANGSQIGNLLRVK